MGWGLEGATAMSGSLPLARRLAPARPLAFSVSDKRLPWSRATLYRWERAGLIPLLRIGGKTLIAASVVDDILAGRIAIPDHPARLHRPVSRKAKP
jgi:hypothetical protein